jgi:pyrroline-5-carboxylate reductase
MTVASNSLDSTTAASSMKFSHHTGAPEPVEQLPQRIAIIGSGTMGRTVAAGVLNASVISHDRLTVTDRSHGVAESVANDLGVTAAQDNAAACAAADVVVLCVKPRDVVGVLNDLVTRGALDHHPLIISLAAGVAISAIEAETGHATPVVRAMPNTPCLIGRGMTVVAKGAFATDADLETARTIFATLGRCIALDEKYLDVVTGVSASGPAFIYVVMEALADGGVMCGLPRNVATELVAQMTLGAASMVLATGRHPSSLKDDVTTPGGCTIAGLLALEDGRVRSVLARAVETATHVAAGLGR